MPFEKTQNFINYGIEINIIFYTDQDFKDIEYRDSINIQNVYEYIVVKDSTSRNFNVHSLILDVDDDLYSNLMGLRVGVEIIIRDDQDIIIENILRIQEVNIIETDDELTKTVGLLLFSEVSTELINSNDMVPKIMSDLHHGVLNATGSDILNSINTHYRQKYNGVKKGMSVFSSDACLNTFLYFNANIPAHTSNMDLLNLPVTENKPYLMVPYIIFDDFHYTAIEEEDSSYALHIQNLCGFKNMINKDIDEIKAHSTFLSSEPILNISDIRAILNSECVLEDPRSGNISKMKPKNSKKALGVKYFKMSEDLIYFKDQLKIKQKMMKEGAVFLTFNFLQLNIEDLAFNRKYNISDTDKYNDVPVMVEYIFTGNGGNFHLSANATFASIANSDELGANSKRNATYTPSPNRLYNANYNPNDILSKNNISFADQYSYDYGLKYHKDNNTFTNSTGLVVARIKPRSSDGSIDLDNEVEEIRMYNNKVIRGKKMNNHFWKIDDKLTADAFGQVIFYENGGPLDNASEFGNSKFSGTVQNVSLPKEQWSGGFPGRDKYGRTSHDSDYEASSDPANLTNFDAKMYPTGPFIEY